MSGSSTASGKLTDALHHLKGTLWCRTVQRSQFPVQKHLCHFPHQHRYNVKTNTAWHQFSQISPKYSTLLLHTRYTKKSYSLWRLTLCVYHVPEQPGSVPLAPQLHPSLPSTAVWKQGSWTEINPTLKQWLLTFIQGHVYLLQCQASDFFWN